MWCLFNTIQGVVLIQSRPNIELVTSSESINMTVKSVTIYTCYNTLNKNISVSI